MKEVNRRPCDVGHKEDVMSQEETARSSLGEGDLQLLGVGGMEKQRDSFE